LAAQKLPARRNNIGQRFFVGEFTWSSITAESTLGGGEKSFL